MLTILFFIYLYKTDRLYKNQLWLIQTEICITYTMRSKLDLLYTYLIDSQNKFALNRVCMTAQRVYFFQYPRFLWNLKEDLDTEQKNPIFDQFKIIEVKFENSPQSFIPCLKFFFRKDFINSYLAFSAWKGLAGCLYSTITY